MSDVSEYLWLVIFGGFIAFYNAWGIGANDCANSFATSVGAKVLTLKKAVYVAAVFEFSGALLMGSHVTDTIRKKIVDTDMFEANPEVLMLGMLCADFASAIWLTIATYLRYPVSTTHSIIGAIVGFSLAYGGADSVVWDKIGMIVASWIISPFIAGLFSLTLFYLVKRYAFKTNNPFEMTLRIFPILTFLTFLINGFFIFYKGTPALKLDKTELWVGIVCAVSMGSVASLISWFYYVPKLRNRTNGVRRINSNRIHPRLDETLNIELTELQTESNTDDLVEESIDMSENLPIEEQLSNEVVYNRELDITNNIGRLKGFVKQLKIKKHDDKILQLHTNADVFDEKSEKACTSLQVITACFSSFAHGANDVANAIAPLATIYAIYSSGEFEKKSDVPIWVLFIGAVGIVIGLATWGYKIIDRIGRELTKVTPSRGFIIELAAATTVVFASRTAIPVSTTHCQVGSVVGCGIGDGRNNVDWKIMKSILFSWLITLPVTGLISAGLFSFCHYSP
tara:strand:- start:12666 stop:14198 length:1533 start_codon:yes stop_codon:yes gene_type:complete